jgi:hypothetical protein
MRPAEWIVKCDGCGWSWSVNLVRRRWWCRRRRMYYGPFWNEGNAARWHTEDAMRDGYADCWPRLRKT